MRADPDIRRSSRAAGEAFPAVAVVLVALSQLPRCSPFDSQPAPDDDSAGADDDTTAAADDDTTAATDDDTTAPPDDDTTPPPDDDSTPYDPWAGPLDCSPGPGSGEPDDCYDGTTYFRPFVQAAVSGYVDKFADLVDWSSGSPYLLDPEGYMDLIVAEVNNAGLCCIRDPNAGDEIAVKHDNAFAESFDILTWEGYARWGDGIYTATCAPAWF